MTCYRLRGARVLHPDGTVVRLPDADVECGEWLAVVGANGAGKTTLLRALALLDAPEGRFETTAAPATIAFVAQRPYLFRGTVRTNLLLACRDGRRADRRRAVDEALAGLGAAGLADRRREALSAGELQRVALARALVERPHVLLLDEPLAPLDDDGARRLRSVLDGLRGVTVVAAAPAVEGTGLGTRARVLGIR